MSNSTLRLVWLAGILCAPGSVRADDAPPPAPPYAGQPQPPPQTYPQPQPQNPAAAAQPYPYAPPPPPVYGYTPTPTGPDEMTYNEGRPIPYGYTKVERKRKGLIIAGSVTLGATYIFSTLVGAIGEDLRRSGSTETDMSAMFVPVFGPFIQAERSETYVAKFWLTTLGAGQTAGAIMLIYGLTSTRTLLVRNDQLSIGPMHGNGATGMTVSGRF